MMAMKMNTVNDEDLIRAAFRAIDKKGTGTISTDVFRFLLTNIGDNKLSDSEVRNFRRIEEAQLRTRPGGRS